MAHELPYGTVEGNDNAAHMHRLRAARNRHPPGSAKYKKFDGMLKDHMRAQQERGGAESEAAKEAKRARSYSSGGSKRKWEGSTSDFFHAAREHATHNRVVDPYNVMGRKGGGWTRAPIGREKIFLHSAGTASTALGGLDAAIGLGIGVHSAKKIAHVNRDTNAQYAKWENKLKNRATKVGDLAYYTRWEHGHREQVKKGKRKQANASRVQYAGGVAMGAGAAADGVIQADNAQGFFRRGFSRHLEQHMYKTQTRIPHTNVWMDGKNSFIHTPTFISSGMRRSMHGKSALLGLAGVGLMMGGAAARARSGSNRIAAQRDFTKGLTKIDNENRKQWLAKKK